MRYLVTFVYWIVAVLMLSLILVSFDYGFGRAFFLATSLLPGMLCAKFFLPEALRAPHHKVVIVLCVILGILLIEWQALLLMNMYVALHPFSKLPDLFSNPIFILVLLAAFVLPEEMLSHYLQQRMSTREEEISFISNRRKVTPSLTDILFVESNDNEVILHAVAACYRTKTRIS